MRQCDGILPECHQHHPHPRQHADIGVNHVDIEDRPINHLPYLKACIEQMMVFIGQQKGIINCSNTKQHSLRQMPQPPFAV